MKLTDIKQTSLIAETAKGHDHSAEMDAIAAEAAKVFKNKVSVNVSKWGQKDLVIFAITSKNANPSELEWNDELISHTFKQWILSRLAWLSSIKNVEFAVQTSHFVDTRLSKGIYKNFVLTLKSIQK